MLKTIKRQGAIEEPSKSHQRATKEPSKSHQRALKERGINDNQLAGATNPVIELQHSTPGTSPTSYPRCKVTPVSQQGMARVRVRVGVRDGVSVSGHFGNGTSALLLFRRVPSTAAVALVGVGLPTKVRNTPLQIGHQRFNFQQVPSGER